MSRLLVTIVGAAVLVVGAGCGGEESVSPPEATEETLAPTAEAPEPANTIYRIRLRATAQGQQTVRVRGQTNLPDDALLRISASRAFRYTNESEARIVRAAWSTATVSAGSFEAVLTSDEGDMLVGLESDITDLGLGPIAVVDRALTVCALFQTGDDLDGKPRQPNQRVRELVGAHGEQLEGSPQVTVFGSATPTPASWLEASIRVQMESPLLADVAAVQGKKPKVARLSGFCYS